MPIPRSGKTPEMNDQMAIRGVLPDNGPKRLARLLGAPFETARYFFYKHLSAARRREVALALLAEMDRQERSRAAIRQHLLEMAGKDDPVVRIRDGLDIDKVRRAKVGATTSKFLRKTTEQVAAPASRKGRA